jgi:hypothetical protein
MNPAHILFPILVAGFAIPAVVTLRTARAFTRLSQRVSGEIAGIESDGYSESGTIRPTIRIADTTRVYILRDCVASEIKIGVRVEVYISKDFDFAYQNIGLRFWWQPISLSISAIFLAAVYISYHLCFALIL